MDVDILNPAHDQELIVFLDQLGQVNPAVLGYHYPLYRDMLGALQVGTPLYLAARHHGQIVGILPVFYKDAPIGRVYSSLPFFGPNAGVLCASNAADREQIQRVLLQTLVRHAADAPTLSCSVYTPFREGDLAQYDASLSPDYSIEKFTQCLDLATVKWPRDIAYDVRKAQKLGVEVSKTVTPERIEALYAIYAHNCQAYGIPLKPKICLEFLLRTDVIGKYTDVYFAFYDQQMIGGLVMLWSPLTASYYLPCTVETARTLQPSTLLIDQAIQDAKARGIRWWNWESSPSRESGVYQFKRKWGSQEGRYRIYLKTFQPSQIFQHIGVKGIGKHFPYYFVYPFNLLTTGEAS